MTVSIGNLGGKIFYIHGLLGAHRNGLRPGIVSKPAHISPILAKDVHATGLIALHRNVVNDSPRIAVNCNPGRPFRHVSDRYVIDTKSMRSGENVYMLRTSTGIEC